MPGDGVEGEKNKNLAQPSRWEGSRWPTSRAKKKKGLVTKGKEERPKRGGLKEKRHPGVGESLLKRNKATGGNVFVERNQIKKKGMGGKVSEEDMGGK